jgi:diguanylate cyclase (GGDEF)-like protein/PAS domain S-box-containing protein
VDHDLEGVSGIVVVDATSDDLPIVFVSEGFELLTGYSSAEVVGRNPRFLQGPQTDPRSVAALRDAIAAGREAHATVLNYRDDGTPFYNDISIAPEYEHGQLVRWIGVLRDVTDRMRADAQVTELRYFDALTGLANRAALHDELRATLHRARIHDRELALLHVDLDDFKRIDEQYGRETGDALLRAVADRLRGVVRPTDLLARPGGDEFILLVKDVATDAAGIGADLARRIVDALREPLDADTATIEVHASVGVSSFPRDAVSAEDLLRHADAAKSIAKGGGKDGFHLYKSQAVGLGLDPDDAFDPALQRAELSRILDGGLITAVYQPIVELPGERVVAYEALARGPEGSGLHRADRLFAAATAAGRVIELDWACRAAAVRGALEAGLGRSVGLLINCEPSAADAPPPQQHAALWERGMAELDVTIELTERALTDRPAELARALRDHRAAGRGIALDDVGADIHVLALLPLVEPDIIKLDLGLVHERPSTDQAAIVAAVAAQRERTGAAVLAEGLETDEHVATARGLGASLGQGFRFGRPGPLPAPAAGGAAAGLPRARSTRVPGHTPFEIFATQRPTTQIGEELLDAMAHHLDHSALRIGEGAVVLAALQDARHFTAEKAERYEMLARGAALVAAFAVGLPEQPARGVRGARLDPDDPLAAESCVVVLGPHYAGALAARDLGAIGADGGRRYECATTFDRALAIAAARSLMSRIAPAQARHGAQIF